MSDFIRKIAGFYTSNISYSETDSLFIEGKYWVVLDKASLEGGLLCQAKNYSKTGGIFYGLYLAPKKILFNYS